MHRQGALRLLAVGVVLLAGCRDERASSSGVFTQRLGSLSIASFSPQAGSAGTQVTIQGTNLDGVANVHFGSADATFIVDGPTQLRAYVPLGATSGRLNVSDQQGQNSSQSPGVFTVLSTAAPTVSMLSPNAAGVGSTIQIQGTNFTGLTQIAFTGATTTNFVLSGDTSLNVNVPPGVATGTITLTNTVGSGTSGTFTVVPNPVIADFNPKSGTSSQLVTITGSGFTGVASVFINNDPVGSFSISNDGQIVINQVGTAATTGVLTVMKPGAQTQSLVPFTVNARSAPSITTFSPQSGAANGNQSVQVNGSGFQGTSAVRFNGALVTADVHSDSAIFFNVPAGATSGPISVTNSFNTATTAPSNFIVAAQPVVTMLSANSATVGTTLGLTGSGFTGANNVQFGSIGAPATVMNDTTLSVTVPAGAANGPLSVCAPGGCSQGGPSLTVLETARPTLTNIMPPASPVGGMVTLLGTHFSGVTQVTLGGTTAPGFILGANGTSLSVNVPAGAATGQVFVTNSMGANLPGLGLTVNQPPAISSFNPSSGSAGATVNIHGSGLTGTTGVRFGGGPAAAPATITDTLVTVQVPLGSSTGVIELSAPGGVADSTTSYTVIATTAPGITSFAPGSGGPGTLVTVTGSGFTGTSAVLFNTLNAAFYNVISDTQLIASVPNGVVSGPIKVSNAVSQATSGSSFTVVAPPSITNVSPTMGPPGTQVTLTGSSFNGATAVSINNFNLAFAVNSNTQITLTVALGMQSGQFRVVAPGGSTLAATPFQVQSLGPPTITGFTPSSGATNSFTNINGTNFTGTTSVSFNGVPTMNFGVNSDTQLFAYVPNGATSGPISVTNSVSTAMSAGSFTVLPPANITSFSPTSGAPGTPVVIKGSGFTGANQVRFASNVPATFNVDSDTQITATVPVGGATGFIQVGNAQSSSNFTVLGTVQPTVSSFTPGMGGPGAQITVTGAGFTGITMVQFNGVTAQGWFVDSDGSLNANVPNGATNGPISVTNNLGTGTSAGSFTVVAGPTITGFAPAGGAPGTQVTITGTKLSGASQVRFGGSQGSVYNVDSDTQITAVVPGDATNGSIFVIATLGSASSTMPFQVLGANPPVISALVPSSAQQGANVIVQGSGFASATAVSFNGTSASFFNVMSDGQINVDVPNGATSGKVSVTNNKGTGMSPGIFTVLPPPIISGFNPMSGSVGTIVTITGSGFTGSTRVQFGNQDAQFTIDSDLQITATVPLGAGSGQIRVGSANSTASFQVIGTVAPVVSGIAPASGSVGSNVTISGSGFTGTTSVSFNGTPTFFFNVNGDGQIMANVPDGATSGPILVTNAAGSGPSASFTVTAAPVITSFAPPSGVVGATIVITGMHFLGVTNVRFGNPAAQFNVDSDTQITAMVPAGATSGPISVLNTQSSSSFQVLSSALPTISSFSPGSAGSGAQITITGTNFTGVTDVSFNGVSAGNVQLDSDTQLRANVPAAAMTGKISVTNSMGTARSTGPFTVVPPPTISGFAPGSAKVGDSVIITGTKLTGANAVFFNGAQATSFTVDSDTQITVIVPAGARSGSLSVSTPVGQAQSSQNFILLGSVPPTVTGFSASGASGNTISVTGTGFNTVTQVRFNGTPANNVHINSDMQLDVDVPNGATSGPISAINNIGPGSSAASFMVIPPPMVTSFNPTSGQAGATITITGSGFTGAAITVRFNGTPSTSVSGSGTSITATVPIGASSGPISVSAQGGTGSSSTSFTVTSSAAPTISSFAPPSGGVGTQVTVNGTNFTGVTQVKFAGVNAPGLNVLSDTQLTANVPIGAATGPITVINTINMVDSSTSFQVIAKPTVTSFAPGSGGAGASVGVSGTGFTNASQVTINGAGASFVVDSNVHITATVPLGATSGPIAVTTPGGSGQSAASFTVTSSAAPTVSSFNPSIGGAGSSVTVNGANFTGTTQVQFGGVAASSFAVADDTKLTALVPSGAITGVITVINTVGPGGSALLFTVIPPPIITSMSPTSGPSGTPVTLTGSHFTGTDKVQLGFSSCAFTVDSDTQITVTVPSGGSANPFTVHTPGGLAMSPMTFAVQSSGQPTITSFTPLSGGTGLAVILTGTNFTGLTGASFNGTVALFVAPMSDTQAITVVPAGATSGKITLTNGSGSGMSTTDFTVDNSGPTLTNVNPSAAAPGATVVLTGTGLSAATQLSFGGGSGGNSPFTIDSDTQITTSVPANTPAGPSAILVTLSNEPTPLLTGITIVNPPLVAGFSPTSGLYGSTVTINGSGFTGATQVAFNGVATALFSVLNDTQITATVPVGATVGPIRVTNPIGNATSAGNFTPIIPPPVVSSVAPSSGPAAGGTSITISGSAFQNGATVTVGGTAATLVNVVDSTTITATTPMHASGAVTVAVTNPDTQTGQKAGAFTYVAAPNPTLIAPPAGSSNGGSMVTLTGTGFAAGATVTLGGSAALVGTITATSISAMTSAHAPGTVDVVVKNSDGQTGTLAAAFTYNSAAAPVLQTVMPGIGSANGGTVLTLAGSSFAAGATVTVGGTPATNVTFSDATTVFATTPAHASGMVAVTLTNPDGKSTTLMNAFNYTSAAAPIITTVVPGSGSSLGGSGVTVNGNGFASGAAVRFGGALVTSVVVAADGNSLTALTAAHAAGTVDVVVTNPDTQSATKTGGFAYTAAPAPTLTSISPGSGPTIGGTSVTLVGTGYVTGTTVKFGATPASVTVAGNGLSITAIAPPHAAGATDVTVTNPDGQSVTESGAFNYTGSPAPTIASVSPAAGSSNGGTPITVTGTGFSNAIAITLGGNAAGSVVVAANGLSLTAVTAAHPAGPVDVVVTNPDGKSATRSGGFTFVAAAAPTLATVAPANGPSAGGTAVTLTGTNFVGASVSFGGTAASSVNLVSPTTLDVTAPAHAAGPVDVVVTNADGQTATKTNGFTFDAPPDLMPPPDLLAPADLSTMAPVDLSMTPADMTVVSPPDLAMPAPSDLSTTGPAPDLSTPPPQNHSGCQIGGGASAAGAPLLLLVLALLIVRGRKRGRRT